LAGRLRQIAARGGRTVDQLTPQEHYTLGVRAAAQWTTGQVAAAPLADEDLPPELASVVHVMALAESLINGDGVPDQVAALAGGVRAWLVWLIGAADRMVFSTLE
jgi:hypothetical protein